MISFILEQGTLSFAQKPKLMAAWDVSNTDLARVHRARKRLVKSIENCVK